MGKSDQPLNLIGFLFALAIGFWGIDMVVYFQEGPYSRIAISKDSLDEMATKPPGTVAAVLSSFKGEEFKTKDELENKLDKALSVLLVTEKNKYTEIIKSAASAAAKFPVPTPPIWILTMVAGMVFLADIVCIIWWYAQYIHKIQTTATLLTYFLDFGVCAMFNIAANKWTTPTVFLWAALSGSLLLGWRFINLYRSQEANDTDRRILRAARNWLLLAMIISLAFLGLLETLLPDDKRIILDNAYVHPFLLIALSLIGIGLTVAFREKLRVSADIHESSTLPFVPMNLHWPSELADDKDSIKRIADDTLDGLKRFRGLFRQGELKHDRLLSRVHPEGDLHVQSYILATPSWTPNEEPKVKTDEVRNKAFMVGVSHWIDDLVDGRAELASVYEIIRPTWPER